MSDSMLLSVAAFVFVMMCIGLGLTVWEFRYGQPRREQEQARGETRVTTSDAMRVSTARAQG